MLDVAAAVLGVVVVVGTARLLRHWRAPLEDPYWKQPRGWPWSHVAWLGIIRIAVPAGFGCLGLALTAVHGVVGAAGAIIFAVALAVAAVIFFFNRPRQLVPPGLRGLDGWFVSRRSRRDY